MRDIPLFPLNTVLFPGMPIYLHIFEERYQLMMNRCIAENQPVGVVLIREGQETYGPVETYTVGCAARILEVEKLNEGRMNMTALGDERFHILETQTDQPYLSGRVEYMPLRTGHLLEVLRGMSAFKKNVTRYLARMHAGEAIDFSTLEWPDDPLSMVYLAASLLEVPWREKQLLLEIPEAGDLFYEAMRLYRRELAIH
jgi:Lon protease-like protein